MVSSGFKVEPAVSSVMRLGRLALALTASLLIVAAAAAVKLGRLQVHYEVTPAPQPPSLSPSVVQLDLGSIPSGSTGSRDFGEVGVLELPVETDVAFTLDTSTAKDFETLAIEVSLYMDGARVATANLNLEAPSTTLHLDAGTYRLRVEVEYKAVSVAEARSGYITVEVSWLG